MTQFDKYKQNPSGIFTCMVGVSYGTFSIILDKLQVTFIEYQNEQLTRKGGRKCSLILADQLLLTMLYLRNYDTLLNIGFQSLRQSDWH